MREILFRGKLPQSGAWICGNASVLRPPEVGASILHNGTYQWVLPETLGQYIGLTDRNGTKVYEGDILTDGRHNYRVVYDVDICSFVALTAEETYFRPALCKGSLEHLQVIGNIHDNPGLLTGGESP